MIYTEDEAKTKWCPEARVAVPLQDKSLTSAREFFAAVAANRVGLSDQVVMTDGDDAKMNPKSARCLASECCMWRWLMVNQHGTGASLNMDGTLKFTTVNPRGYCGKAGAIPR